MTQFGGAVQRAEFWPSVSTSSPNWHTLLDSTPTVYPTQVIQVPQGQAVLLIGSVSHKVFGLMSGSWFSDRLNEAINSLHIAPTTLPVVLTYNTFLYIHNLNNCCVLGFHGATLSLNGNGNQQIQTYIYAAWPDPNIFPPGWADVLPMSHEVSEGMNDPFIRNFVPPWQFPSGDWRIHLAPGGRGPPAVVHAGIALGGDRRRVQLSGYDKADDTLATLPIIARQKSWRRRKSSAAPLFILRRFSGVAVRHGEDVLVPIGCNSRLEEGWGPKKKCNNRGDLFILNRQAWTASKMREGGRTVRNVKSAWVTPRES